MYYILKNSYIILKKMSLINLKTLLKGLLTKFEKDRWGWNDIFESEFYKELDKKYKE